MIPKCTRPRLPRCLRSPAHPTWVNGQWNRKSWLSSLRAIRLVYRATSASRSLSNFGTSAGGAVSGSSYSTTHVSANSSSAAGRVVIPASSAKDPVAWTREYDEVCESGTGKKEHHRLARAGMLSHQTPHGQSLCEDAGSILQLSPAVHRERLNWGELHH
jgi:hypothetical protein